RAEHEALRLSGRNQPRQHRAQRLRQVVPFEHLRNRLFLSPAEHRDVQRVAFGFRDGRLTLVRAIAALAAPEGRAVEVAVDLAIARSELAEVRALLLLVHGDADVRPDLVTAIEGDELPFLGV